MAIVFHIFYIIGIAVSAICYSCELTEPGMILGKVSAYLEEKFPKWLYLPLIGCYKCVSGQWVLWTYYYFCSFMGLEYSVLFHVETILITIFTAICIMHIYTIIHRYAAKV